MPDQPARVFTSNVERLAETSAAIARAARGDGARPWQTPPEDAWPGGHDDPAAITAAFDRSELAAARARSLSDPAAPGTVGDSVARGAQVAYVGAMERAYRARHASPVRCLAVASGRRAGHGRPRGVLLGGAVGHVQDALAAGGAGG